MRFCSANWLLDGNPFRSMETIYCPLLTHDESHGYELTPKFKIDKAL